ncbi:MAG TPA: zinc ribbon domain-containing protein [Acidimicrobiales bacterium]
MSHEPIITVEEWEAVQSRITVAPPVATVRKARATPRPYVLRRVMRCGLCERRMEGTWNNGAAYYRCRYPIEYATTNGCHPKTVYVRESLILKVVEPRLERAFDDDHIEDTRAAVIAGLEVLASDVNSTDRAGQARETIAQCDVRLANYRRALDDGG